MSWYRILSLFYTPKLKKFLELSSDFVLST